MQNRWLFGLACGFHHILDKDPVALRGVIDQHVGHRAHDFPVLQNRAAAHADVK